MKDIRDILPKGRDGTGKIDSAEVVPDANHVHPVFSMTITVDGKKYIAEKCHLQTEGWKPKKGDTVKFDRQPESVDDTYLYASKVAV